MKGMKYRIAIATIGVISNVPTVGITRLSGDKIGSVTSLSKISSRFWRPIINHDNIARTKTATAKIRQR